MDRSTAQLTRSFPEPPVVDRDWTPADTVAEVSRRYEARKMAKEEPQVKGFQTLGHLLDALCAINDNPKAVTGVWHLFFLGAIGCIEIRGNRQRVTPAGVKVIDEWRASHDGRIIA